MIKESLTIEGQPNKVDFAMEVENIVQEVGLTYIAAVLEVAEKYNIDVAKVNQYIGPSIKENMRLEGEESGQLKRTSRPAVRFE